MSLWGRGPTEVYASGDSGTVLRYDGVAWRNLTVPPGGPLYSLFVQQGTNAVITVGDRARVLEATP